MSKKYMSRPPYCFGDIPEYFMPPMTVEEYRAYEAKYFDFLEPTEIMVEQPQQDGVFSRFVRFIGMSKSITLDGDGADVQKSPNKTQGGGDKEETVCKLLRTDSRGSGVDDNKTVTDNVAEAEMDCKIATDMAEAEMHCKSATDMVEAEAEAEIDTNTNPDSYKLKEESNDQTTDVHAVSSQDSAKEFTSCRLQLLNESPVNGDDEVKPKKGFWKSLRKFFRRPFRTCLKTEE